MVCAIQIGSKYAIDRGHFRPVKFFVFVVNGDAIHVFSPGGDDVLNVGSVQIGPSNLMCISVRPIHFSIRFIVGKGIRGPETGKNGGRRRTIHIGFFNSAFVLIYPVNLV